MAENTRIILRSLETEIFKSRDYKLYPLLINTALTSSGITSTATAISLNGTFINISGLNNSSDFAIVNSLRNPAISYENLLSTGSDYIESIPKHHNILETMDNIERTAANEYPRKKALLSYMKSNLYDLNYSVASNNFGRAFKITPTIINAQTAKIESTPSRLISGYVKVENAPDNIQINIILRGVPLPMKKIKTSNGNYMFIYPNYIMNNIEIIQSIQSLEIKNYNSSTEFWYGSSYVFTLTDLIGYSDKVANLHIINKEFRNILSLETAS
jgi:hypothetical protein